MSIGSIQHGASVRCIRMTVKVALTYECVGALKISGKPRYVNATRVLCGRGLPYLEVQWRLSLWRHYASCCLGVTAFKNLGFRESQKTRIPVTTWLMENLFLIKTACYQFVNDLCNVSENTWVWTKCARNWFR